MAGVGVVSCRMINDRRGPGVLFELRSGSAWSPDAAVPSELEELVADGDGLVVVTGPTARDRSLVAHALVDVINRRRAAYVVTLESSPTAVHDHQKALVSQRLIAGGADAWSSGIEQAIIEAPDVLFVDAPGLSVATRQAVSYAGQGTLVILTVAATSAIEALQHMVGDGAGETETSRQVAAALTAMTSRTTLPRRTGGRVNAYEVLIGTPALRALTAARAFERLSFALERGEDGARSMAVALADLVATQQVARHAALRAAPDPAALRIALQLGDASRHANGSGAVADLTTLLDDGRGATT
jgi:twitching motility protein PilT